MAVRRIKYRTLQQLLRNELVPHEDPGTAELISRLRHVKRRRDFSRAEFLEMCRWKSPRVMLLYARNSEATIRQISRAVLATRSEKRRLELLASLRGVSVPVASAILTLVDPAHYGVLDIRVWQLLFAMKEVRTNPRGVGFAFAHWAEYLRVLRRCAKAFGVSARTIERTLFACHRKVQKDRLYDPIISARRPGASGGKGLLRSR